MGIAVLNELQDRLYTSAIAGANLLNEDFRLKRALEQLETLSASAPVLKKVYEQVKPVTEPACKDKEAALMDAITLIDAVVCTQGGFEEQGEISPIPLSEGNSLSQHRYSELQPLIQALSEKGSGRLEIIENAWKEKNSILQDYRLIPYLVKALGDSYFEIADLVQMILSTMGENIIPFLKEGFDLKDKREMRRRLEIIKKIAKKKENDFYLGLLENSCTEIKEEAIHALSYDETNVDKLIELTVTEKGSPKKYAQYILGSMENEKAIGYWEKQLSKKSSTAEKYLIFNQSDRISDLLAEKLDKLIDELLACKSKKSVSDDLSERIGLAIVSLSGKSSPKMIKAICRLAENQKYLKDLHSSKGQLILAGFSLLEDQFCSDFKWSINGMLIIGMAYFRSEKLITAMKKLFYKNTAFFSAVGLTSFMLSEPENSYDRMEPYFTGFKEVEGIIKSLQYMRYVNDEKKYQLFYYIEKIPKMDGWHAVDISRNMDIRWFKKFISEEDSPFHYILQPVISSTVENLIDFENQELVSLMRDFYYKNAKEGKNCLLALSKCGFKDFKGLVPLNLTKQDDFGYSLIVRYYRFLPLSIDDIITELYQIIDMIQKGEIRCKQNFELERLKKAAEVLKKHRSTFYL